MCCTLVDRDFKENGQGFAGRMGSDPDMADFATEQALFGCLVSSLHRLKDFNNTGDYDTGFHFAHLKLTFPIRRGVFCIS